MEEMQNAVVTEQNEPIEALPTGEEGEIHKESKEAMATGNKEAEAQEPTKGDAQSPQGEPLVPQEEKAEEVEPSLSDELAKKQEELAQREAILLQKEKEMERQDLRKEVKESLLKVGIGEGLIDPVLNLNLTKEETLAVITGLGENFQKELERKLEEKLEGKTPMASKDNFIASAGNVMGEFQRTKVVPEVDAYRYSKVFAVINEKASENVKAKALTEKDIYKEIASDIAMVRDKCGQKTELLSYVQE